MKKAKIYVLGIGFLLVTIGFLLFRSDRVVDVGQPYAPTSTPKKISSLRVRGSVPYWDQEKAYESFSNHAYRFDSISLFWYYVTEDGDITLYEDAQEDISLIEYAHKQNVKVAAVLTNLPEEEGTTWDSERVETILENDQKQEEHIEELITKLKTMSFDGVAIDFEEVEEGYSQQFTQYIKNLTKAAHQENLFVGVALHPKHGFVTDKRYEFQDWKALSAVADELYIMAYGEHWDGGEAGPIASIQWVEQILRYGKAQDVSLSKFYLGVPLYGYDWRENSDDEEATGLTYMQVQALIAKHEINPEYDRRVEAPNFDYETNGFSHEVWYEDQQSVAQKVALAKEYGLGGVTFWRLGGEDQRIWATSSGIFTE
jgi:spore germination protein